MPGSASPVRPSVVAREAVVDTRRLTSVMVFATAVALAAGWGFLHMMRVGSCTTNARYVSSHPCPAGSSLWITLFVVGIFFALCGVLAGAAIGALRLVLGTALLAFALLALADALTGHGLDGPRDATDWILAAIAGLPALWLLAVGIPARIAATRGG